MHLKKAKQKMWTQFGNQALMPKLYGQLWIPNKLISYQKKKKLIDWQIERNSQSLEEKFSTSISS